MQQAPSLRPFWMKRRYYLPLVIGVLANGIIYGAVTYRLATKQERLAREHESLSQSVADRREVLARLEHDRERAAKNEEMANRFWSETVQAWDPGVTKAIAELHRLAKEAGVVRGRTTYKIEELDIGLVEVRVSMPLQGTYFDLIGFINRVERSPQFFLVRQIGLRREENAGDLIGLNCEVSFFLRGDGSEGAKTS